MKSLQDSHTKSHRNSKKKISNIYTNTLITKKVNVQSIYVNKNIKDTLESIIKNDIEGKCIIEGYIKSGSSKILTYSSGLVNGSNIIFEVVFECLICCPTEGMIINCIVKNITKAGIRAEIDEIPSPVVIFIARDHHYMSKSFSSVNENDIISIKVIGQRFELNDKYISVIAELIDSKDNNEKKEKKKPNLILK